MTLLKSVCFLLVAHQTISYIKASDQQRLSILSESAYLKEENVAQNNTWSLTSKNHRHRTRQLIKRIQRYVPSSLN